MKLDLGWRYNLILILLGGLFLLFSKWAFLSSLFLTNLGLLSLTRTWVAGEAYGSLTTDQKIVALFERAAQRSPENNRARWYLRLAYLRQGNISNALDVSLSDPAFSDSTLRLAKIALKTDQTDAALFWFAAGSHFDSQAGLENFFQWGKLCQRQYASLSVSSSPGADLCASFWNFSDGNLLINGQFEREWLGWAGLIPVEEQNVRYTIDEAEGQPGPSMKIVGQRPKYHGGRFQLLYLPAGAILDYRVRIKTQAEDQLRVEVLVWQIRQSDQPAAYTQVISTSQDWTLYEDTIILPDDKDQMAIFAPVRVWGKGAVWVDEVSLTVSEKESTKNLR